MTQPVPAKHALCALALARPMQRLLAMKRLGRTPPFRAPNGDALAGSIAEISYHSLGGLDQWVLMRGASTANPPLIMLHGGPGFSETSFFRYYNASLERSFTVVYWDQRGAGKSFTPHIPRESMTLERFVADLDELVEIVRTRLAQPKVVLFGHSWGSVLGSVYAARFPEKVAAYVGSGQIGDARAAESASYAYALAEAERRGATSIARKLRAIGPPPYPAASLWVERMSVSRLDGALRLRALWKLGRMMLASKESSLRELPDSFRGFRWTIDVMWDETSRLNLCELAPALAVPVFFFLGRNDHWVPLETSLAYFDMLRAPSKRLVVFERSGHEPFVDEAPAFDAAMVELVRPAVTATAPARAA